MFSISARQQSESETDMDPEVTLAEIRENLVRWYEQDNFNALEDAALATENLIEWLDKGGHLPQCWRG